MTHTRISLGETPEGLYEKMLNIEKYIRECGLPASLVHLVKVRASQINGCGYCLDMHHKDALAEGESPERLYLLPAWKESPCYTESEKVVLGLTDTLTTLNVAEPEAVEVAYERMAEHFTKEEIANIVMTICQINSWNRIAVTFGNVPGSYKR